MKHLGDITKINGHNVPIVDVITGGSPCQDLSVAGKRAGLDGERSGLFMEQIRIIKEMRNEFTKQLSMRGADVNVCGIKPRFMVWENVPGAFSSPGCKNGEDHRGEDFQAVLTEIVRVVKANAPDVPLPHDRKWTKSGCLMGIGDNGHPFSIAWRLHDAQFWGVPQRRKRIALVADFGGTSAPEILFERKGVSGNTTESRNEGQRTSTDTERSVDKAKPNKTSYTLKVRGGREVDSNGKKAGKGALVQKELSATLGVSQDQTLITVAIEGNGTRPSHQGDEYKESDVSYTLNSTEKHAVCFEPGSMSRVGGHYYEDGKSGTLRANAGDNQQAVCFSQDAYDKYAESEKSSILKHSGGNYGGERDYSSTVGALCARDYKGVGNQYVNEGKCIVQDIGEPSGR